MNIIIIIQNEKKMTPMNEWKEKLKNFIDWATDHRNMLFLLVCLLVHALYFCAFCILNVESLALVNFLSTCFYAYFLFIKKDTSEKAMAISYFEILLFSLISNGAVGSDSGFCLYAVGMSASVFYLVPSYGNKRFLYQIIGIIFALATEGIVRITGLTFPNTHARVEPYQTVFFLINLLITSAISLAATIFYSKRKDTIEEFMRYNMYHDALTGLYNRRFLERQMEQNGETSKKDYVLCILDIDFFKKVNDTYGHTIGDVVLARLSELIKTTVCSENLAIRWGGEEFVLYFPDATPDAVYSLMEDLRKHVENTVIETAEHRIQITITVGIGIGRAGRNYQKVLRIADEKLYYGKQHGRNQVVI